MLYCPRVKQSSTSPPRAVALVLAACLALLLPAAPASADDPFVEVTAQVRGLDGATLGPLAGVQVRAEKWLGADSEWEPVLSGDTLVTDQDGYFTVYLEADADYTLRFEAHGPRPTQYLGGGPTPPSGPGAADWNVATFVAADGLPGASVTLARESLFSVSGHVVGDEEGADISGAVDLYEFSGDHVSEDDYLSTTEIQADGVFVFHGLRAGRRYTVRASSDAYLQTFLGGTTQPELADSFTVDSQGTAIDEVALRRGATVTGTVTSMGAPVTSAHVTALRWDPVGTQWLEPTHYQPGPTETWTDGYWQLVLEPGARYTLFVDTSDASAMGEVPASQFLGGRMIGDGATTFELLPAGHELEVSLAPPVVERISAPVVSGRAELGVRLSSTAGAWHVQGLSVARQWLRAGSPIAGATGATYTPTVADLGKRLSVRVTVGKVGYRTTTTTSSQTGPVARARTTTTVALSRSATAFGTKVRATVTVRSVAGIPNGKVTLRVGSKVVGARIPSVKGTRATATFTVPRTLKTGTHRVTATTATTTSTAASSAPAQRLKITKAKAKVKVKGPKKWRLKKGKRPSLTITVKGTKGGPAPRGKITVKIGKKTYTKSVKTGKIKIKGPRLTKRSSVKVRVTYRPVAKTYTKPKMVKKTLRVR